MPSAAHTRFDERPSAASPTRVTGSPGSAMRASPSRGESPSESTSRSHSNRLPAAPAAQRDRPHGASTPDAPRARRRRSRSRPVPASGSEPASAAPTDGRRDLDPGVDQRRAGARSPSSVPHDHDRTVAGAHAVHACERGRRPAEHHARQVVAGEDAVLLDWLRSPRRSRSRMHVHELAVTGERHVQPLVDAERRVALEHGHGVERAHLGLERDEPVQRRTRARSCGRSGPRRTRAPNPRPRRRAPPRGPAMPAPTTSVSTCSCRTTCRVAAAVAGRRPSPVARRITRSATGHANRGLMNVL